MFSQVCAAFRPRHLEILQRQRKTSRHQLMGSTAADALDAVPIAVPVAGGKTDAVVVIHVPAQACGDSSPAVDERSRRIDWCAVFGRVWDALGFVLELIVCLMRWVSLCMAIFGDSDGAYFPGDTGDSTPLLGASTGGSRSS